VARIAVTLFNKFVRLLTKDGGSDSAAVTGAGALSRLGHDNILRCELLVLSVVGRVWCHVGGDVVWVVYERDQASDVG